MEERAIHISSINRGKRGTSRPGDFTIKFNPSLKLDPDKSHQLALDRLSKLLCSLIEHVADDCKEL